MDAKDNTEKWLQFLDPENLKSNLMFSSLFIASFESFKDYVVEEVKFFYNTGFMDGQYTFDQKYEAEVKSKDKSIVKATLLWLVDDMEAIDNADIQIFESLREYRNKLSHELMNLLFEGLSEELPTKLFQLIDLRIKIEKWWVLNIEIPTNPDFDANTEITEENITTSSQMFNRLLLDMLLGDEKTSTYYKNEFIKKHP